MEEKMTSKRRAELRGMANRLEPLFHVGKSGVTPAVIAQTNEVFNTRELIKLKVLLESAPEKPREIAEKIAAETSSQVVQVIGGSIILYKENPDIENGVVKKKKAPEKKKSGVGKGAKDFKKVYNDYFVLEEYEAGIELFGTEIKSIRQGKINLKDAWCNIVDGEIFVNGIHISPYDHGNIFNRDPMRVRKLLMHKKEINKLFGTVKQDGLSLIPLSVYFKKGRAKIKVGLCKGKKLYDKRDVAAKKDAARNIERAMKERFQ